MLCFRCGSYNVDDATVCSVCGQAFLDDKGQEVAGVSRTPSGVRLTATIFAPGELVSGRYKILETLGQGGVGVVYRARDQELDADVALKAISTNLLQTPEEQRLFSRQMKQARKLNHPNIIRIYDEGHEQNRRYFTMKLLEGLTLRKIIRLRHDKGQAFTAEEIIPIVHQLAAAFDYAHKSTWHGDLKPENIVILPDVLKVTDFNLMKGLPLKPFLGIAKSRSRGFHYIAPEIRVEASRIDGRADIYSLGVILGEMLTGIIFEGTFTRAFTAALEQMPPKVDALIRKALSEHPDARYQKSSELARALDDALSDLPPEGIPPPADLVSSEAPIAPPRQTPTATPPPPPLETSPGQTGITSLSSEEMSYELGSVELDGPEEIGPSQIEMLDEASEPSWDSRSDTGPETPKARAEELVSDDSLVSYDDLEPLDDLEEISDELHTESGAAVSDDTGLPDDSELDDLSSSLELYADEMSELPDENELESLDDISDAKVAKGDPALRAPISANETSDETNPDLEQVGIHEELTALKPSPPLLDLDLESSVTSPPALLNDRLERGSDTAAEENAILFAEPGDSDADQSAEEDLAAVAADLDHELGLEPISEDDIDAVKERSSPRLHSAAALPPPVAAPAQKTEVPPTLRPVTPPERDAAGNNTYVIIAAVALLAVAIGWLVSGGEKAPVANTPAPTVAQNATGPETQPVPAVAANMPTANIATPQPAPATEGTQAQDALALAANTGAGAVEGIDTETQIAEAARQASELAAEQARKAEEAKRAQEAMVAAQQAEEQLRAQAEMQAEQARRVAEEQRQAAEAARALEAARAEEQRRVAAAKRAEEQRRAAEAKRAEDQRRAAAAKRAEDERRAAKARKATAAGAAGTKVAAMPTKPKGCPRGMKMIPAGSFIFGTQTSDPMRNFGENAAAKTNLPSYCIDYYEYPNGARQPPATGVTWNQAKRACERRGKRLCSEAEWERACKGSRNRFTYGNTYAPGVCNTANGAGQGVQPAAAFPKCRSPHNVLAMSGNAEEWTADSFRPGAPSKTVKGGAADRPDWASRCSARRGLAARSTKATLGFRCCADAQ